MFFSYRKDSNVLLFPCTDTDIFIQIFQNLRKRPFFHNFALHSQINMNKSTVTISDVAKAAGVTRGTIDRVLHERGEVSEETRAKVLKVIKELGYKTNVYASMLAKNKSHDIAVILPKYKKGEFWELAHVGIEKAREYAGRFSVNVDECTYDQYSVDSFLAECRKVIKTGYSGIIIATMFLPATRTIAVEIEEANIPYIILNTSVNGIYGHLAYYGQPIYDSGAFCADMLMTNSDEKSLDTIYLVRIERDVNGLSDPSAERRHGFLDYLSAHYPETTVKSIVINPNNAMEANKAMDDAFRNIDGCPNIVTLNSRIFLVADYLREHRKKGWNVVGFDILQKNIDALKDGYVKYLIGQHADIDAQKSIITLTDHLILGKRPEKQDNYSSIDLLSRYNYHFY